MNSPIAIYIPGYREECKPKFPGYELQKYCKENKRKFARLILPGEPRSGMSFSGSAIRQKINQYLSSVQNISLNISVYSLSCREVADAILEANEKMLSLIQSVNFIHPNTDPLYSVRVMDWATNRDLALLQNEDKYLYGDPDVVFQSLMQPVGDSEKSSGNPKGFQLDLQRYKNEDLAGKTFTSKIIELKRKGVSCNIESSLKDKITNPEFYDEHQDRTVRLKRRKISAISSHIPSRETLKRVYDNIQRAD